MERAEEIDAAFAAHDCPGVAKCFNDRKPGESWDLHACAGCKAPKAIWLKNPPTKVYRSYADYCDD